MSKDNNYNDGWQDGYWFGSGTAYDRGYEEGAQAERNRIKHAVDGNSYDKESSTLMAMIGGSIGLTLFGWCWVGVILLLLWVSGYSGSWWFSWIWRVAFWGGIGFVAVMSVAGIIMKVIEHLKPDNTLEKPTDNSNEPWYKKYPPADVIRGRKK